MNIFLDTNIIRGDLPLNGHWSKLLLTYVERTGATILMPEIAWDELRSVYRRELEQRTQEWKTARKNLNFLLVEAPPNPEIDLDQETETYLNYVRGKLKLNESRFVSYKDEFLRDIVDRAVRRVRPCSDRGEEFRDALLWLTILDFAASGEQSPVVFLSKNKKEFAGPNGELHATLRQETHDKGVEVFFYEDIKPFLAAHADKLEFVTREWIEAQNAPECVADDIVTLIEYDHDQVLLEWATRRDLMPTGYLVVKSAEVSVESFFIFRRSDEEFAVEVTYSGYATIEFEHEVALKGLSCFNPEYVHREEHLEDFRVGVKAAVELICDGSGYKDAHTVAVSIET